MWNKIIVTNLEMQNINIWTDIKTNNYIKEKNSKFVCLYKLNLIK